MSRELVKRDAKEPSPKAGSSVEPISSDNRSHQGLLSEIFSIVLIPSQLTEKSEKRRMVFLDQLVESAGFAFVDQSSVGQVVQFNFLSLFNRFITVRIR